MCHISSISGVCHQSSCTYWYTNTMIISGIGVLLLYKCKATNMIYFMVTLTLLANAVYGVGFTSFRLRFLLKCFASCFSWYLSTRIFCKIWNNVASIEHIFSNWECICDWCLTLCKNLDAWNVANPIYLGSKVAILWILKLASSKKKWTNSS